MNSSWTCKLCDDRQERRQTKFINPGTCDKYCIQCLKNWGVKCIECQSKFVITSSEKKCPKCIKTKEDELICCVCKYHLVDDNLFTCSKCSENLASKLGKGELTTSFYNGTLYKGDFKDCFYQNCPYFLQLTYSPNRISGSYFDFLQAYQHKKCISFPVPKWITNDMLESFETGVVKSEYYTDWRLRCYLNGVHEIVEARLIPIPNYFKLPE